MACLNDVYQSLSILSVQFSWENYICYCIYHQFFVGLTSKWVFSIFWFNFRLCVLITTLLSLFILVENINIFACAFPSVVFRIDAFGSFKWANRFYLLLFIIYPMNLLIRRNLRLLLVVREIVRYLSWCTWFYVILRLIYFERN